MIFNNNYHTVQGYECLNSCILNYMNYYNIPILGSDISLLGEGLETIYMNMDKPSITSGIYESNFRFMEKIDLQYLHDKDLCETKVEDFVNYHINNESCISIRVSSECLTYNPVFKQTEGAPHYINLIGMDLNNQKIYISDGNVPTFHPSIFEGWVDCIEIFEGWKRKNYEYFIFNIKSVDINISDIHKIAKNNLLNEIHRYFNPRKSEDSVFTYGEDAVKSLLHELRDLFTTNADIKSLLLDINYQLKISGFITTKRYLIEKIRQIYTNIELINEYEKVIQEWNKICLLIVKSGFSRSIVQYDLILEKANEIMKHEKYILCKIISAL